MAPPLSLPLKYYDTLPTSGNEHGRAFRDVELEEQILGLTREMGIGAQFGGKYFCHDGTFCSFVGRKIYTSVCLS
jgi:tartrate dehydratase alpha subunit/fumarate hydratase class I-like protein